jgi:CRISPR-associated exonuclease Cas4
MISALEHWSYCPRQCALIHVEQAFADNVHTLRGHAAHKRVDEPGMESQPGLRVERALPVWSERLGLSGRCDVVEFLADGTPYPVEYKHGPKRVKAHDDLQLAAQAMCLEEMTERPVLRGAVYHVVSRRRREVDIDGNLRVAVEQASQAVRNMLSSGKVPPPVNDGRCKECSLKELCQPEALATPRRWRAMREQLFTLEAD